MSQKPSTIFIVSSFHRVPRHAGSQRDHHLLSAPSAIGEFLLLRRGRSSRTREAGTLLFNGYAKLLEPLLEVEDGDAIILVVAFDSTANVFRDRVDGAQFERPLDDAKACPSSIERNGSHERVEDLHILNRVLLDARSQRMLYDGVKIHEQLCPQHAVDFSLAGRVPAH